MSQPDHLVPPRPHLVPTRGDDLRNRPRPSSPTPTGDEVELESEVEQPKTFTSSPTQGRPENIAATLHDRLVDISLLEAHPKNARRRSKQARAALRDSLARNGQYRTVIARRLPDGRLQLLAGHGTVEAARELGWARVGVDVHDGVDDKTAARIVLADNRTSDLAEYDDTLLAELLGSIADDLLGTGYSDEDFAQLLAANAAGGESFGGLTDPDEAPQVPDVARCRPGDVVLLGEHRLAVGDATDANVWSDAVGGGGR